MLQIDICWILGGGGLLPKRAVANANANAVISRWRPFYWRHLSVIHAQGGELVGSSRKASMYANLGATLAEGI